MANWAKGVPVSRQAGSMDMWPAPVKAQEQYQTENGVASSVISLQPQTTQIEVGTFGGQGATVRWIPRTETAAVSPFASVISSGVAANWDHWVPPGVNRYFVVPQEVQGTQYPGQAGSVFGLYGRVAVINGGATASSILVAEY